MLIQLEILKFGSSSLGICYIISDDYYMLNSLAHLLNSKRLEYKTGFYYDPSHSLHSPPSTSGIQSLEHPNRIELAYFTLTEHNILSKCYPIKPRLVCTPLCTPLPTLAWRYNSMIRSMILIQSQLSIP